MDNDVELMRELLFVLEARQLSPRATVIIDIEEEAFALGETPESIVRGLQTLDELEYIAGGGGTEPGFWLFRKLTRKGVQFVRAARSPQDWERMKQHYAGLRFQSRA